MSEDRTIEQEAWAIVNEAVPAWWNAYSRKYPNSAATEVDHRRSVAHFCVVEALKKEREK